MATGAIQLDREQLEREVSTIRTDIDAANGDTLRYRAQAKQLRSLLDYEQPRVNPPWPGACELVVHYAKSALFALLAHVSPSLLGVDPIYTATGFEGSARFADSMEKTMHLCLQEQRYGLWAEQWFSRIYIDGCAALLTNYRHDSEIRPAWQAQQTFALDELTGEQLYIPGDYTRVETMQDVFDGPDYWVLDIEHFGMFPDPSVAPEDSPGAWYKHYLTGWQLLARSQERDSDNKPIYDPVGVAQLLARGGQVGTLDNADAEQFLLTVGTGGIDSNTRMHKYSIIEAYWDTTVAGKRRKWVYTYEETSGIVLRARPQPEWHGEPPFVVGKAYGIGGGMGGDSVFTAGAGHTQQWQTTLFRVALDAMTIGVLPEMLMAASLGEDINRLKHRRGPGAIIPFPDQYMDQPFAKPFGSGYAPTMVLPMLEYLDHFGQQTTGAVDALKAMPSTTNITATQASQLLEASQKLLSWQSEHLAAAMDHVGRQTHAQLLSHMGNPFPQRWWREAQGEDGIQATLEEAMTAGRYRFSANGVRTTQNKQILAENAMKLFEISANLPEVRGNPQRWYNVLSQTLNMGLGVRDPQTIIGTLQEWQQQQQQQAMAMQQGLPGEGMPMEGLPPAMDMPQLGPVEGGVIG